MNIGLKIKELRQTKGMTQEELARSISKSRSALQKYENGEIALTIDVLEDIAKALDIHMVNFFTDDMDDILLLVIDRFNLKDNKRGQIEYDFKLFMDILKAKYQ